MTRRSITNERYTTEDAKKGVTRKSASKAKPAKEAAGTVYVASNQKKSKKELRQEEYEKEEKRRKRNESKSNAAQTESELSADSEIQQEIKAWRKRWWVCVIMGIVLVILAWVAQNISEALFLVNIIAAYVMVGVAIYIEFAKIGQLHKKEDEGESDKLTNKQLKHKMEAEKLEESRNAAKKSKSRRRRGKKKEDEIENYPMDESSEK